MFFAISRKHVVGHNFLTKARRIMIYILIYIFYNDIYFCVLDYVLEEVKESAGTILIFLIKLFIF